MKKGTGRWAGMIVQVKTIKQQVRSAILRGVV